MEALDSLHFKEATEIQEAVIPLIQAGEDVIAQSQTGSGKSHAFLLPFMNEIDPSLDQVQLLITAPSRELADQLFQKADELASFSKDQINVQKYIGGTEKSRQVSRLENRQPHVAIGTPGRLLDLVKSNDLKIHKTPYLVIDEADMTMDLGFIQEVDQLAAAMPKDLQMAAFSATIPDQLEHFLRKYMSQPKFIQIGGKQAIADSIQNVLIPVKGRDRKELVYQLATMGNPYLALIFANTKQKVDELEAFLMEKGLSVGKIHGDLTSRERRRMLRRIENLDFQYIVATDLAARGIDIPGVSHVINAEIPTELEFFIHRVGRTGRNQLDGLALTLYEPEESEAISYLEDRGIEFEYMDYRRGELVETASRHRRQERKDQHLQQREYHPELNRIKQRNKKSIKPGYKKKMKRTLQEARRKKGRNQRKK